MKVQSLSFGRWMGGVYIYISSLSWILVSDDNLTCAGPPVWGKSDRCRIFFDIYKFAPYRWVWGSAPDPPIYGQTCRLEENLVSVAPANTGGPSALTISTISDNLDARFIPEALAG